MADSGQPQVGDEVVAIGSPDSLEGTVSNGIVSRFDDENGVKFIQMTAPISHGSSGGALLNMSGDVIGVTAYKKAGEGLNFAIPVSYITPLLAAIHDVIPLGGLPATISFESEPAGAVVYVDDVLIGKTPTTVKLKPGQHGFRMFMNGYQNWVEWLTIQKGSTLNLVAPLQISH